MVVSQNKLIVVVGGPVGGGVGIAEAVLPPAGAAVEDTTGL